MRYVFIIAFLLMAGAQWYVPISMISDSQETLLKGGEYKFKTRPVDPSDPFRGKYITLNFDAEIYHPDDTNQLKFLPKQKVYAIIGEDKGFATIETLLAEKPEVEFPYLEAYVQYTFGADISESQATVSLEFPFNKFYLEESKASEAEQVAWQSQLDTAVVCYAKVKIHKGKARIVDVIVNDSSIVDVVRRINAKKQ